MASGASAAPDVLDGHDPEDLKETCPAFKEGCPFKDAVMVPSPNDIGKETQPQHQAATHATAKALERAREACPAFKDGCPFKDASELSEVWQQLSNVPPSHAESALYGLRDMFRHVHEVSAQEREKVGECPVFLSSCPFKTTVTSSGKSLVSELDQRAWSLAALQSEDVNLNAEGEPLSKNLKKGTRKAHRAAESVQFVRQFLKGRVEKSTYKLMIANLYHVYKALEEECSRNAEHEVWGKMHMPDELERTEALAQDCEYYFEGDDIPPPSPAAQSYVDRLHEIGVKNPSLLVAHAYTRYLGDLSGGQTLARVAKKTMNLKDDGRGTAFYEFEKIPRKQHKAFKNAYREKLDSLRVSSAVADELVNEANLAFAFNTAMFEELDVVAGFVSEEDLAKRREAARESFENATEEEKSKCPFAAFIGKDLMKTMPLPAGHSKISSRAAAVASTTNDTSQAVSGCPVHPSALMHMLVNADTETIICIIVVIACFIIGVHQTRQAE